MTDYLGIFAAAFVGAVVGAVWARGSSSADLARLNHKLSRIAAGLKIDLAPALPEHVVELVRSGRKIDAIKELRTLNPGLGLKEAKDQVDLVE